MFKVTYVFKDGKQLTKYTGFISGAISYHRHLMLQDPNYVTCLIQVKGV